MSTEPLTLQCHDGRHKRCHGYIAPTFTVACHCSCHEVPDGQPRDWSAATGRDDPADSQQPDPAQPLGQVFYLVDGEPYAGSFADYARAHQMAHYAGLDVPEVVWTWTVVLTPDAPGGASWGWTYHEVEVTSEPYDTDDWGTVVLRAERHEASYRIDGRA